MSDRTPSIPSNELSFSRSFFGYDPLEVRAFVAETQDRMQRLAAQQDASGGPDGRDDLGTAIASAVSDISELLEAARRTSEKIRQRAEQDAAELLAEGDDGASKILASAESDAYALRKGAWDTSTEILEAVKSEAVRLHSVAKQDALDIIGEAERKIHRKMAATRRDSDNTLQAAAAESERILGLARSKGQEIIRAAKSQMEIAKEKVSTMEVRHEALKREVEEYIGRLEGPPVDSQSAEKPAVRIVTSGDQAPADEGSDFDTPVTEDRSEHGEEKPGEGDAAYFAGWADGTSNIRLITPSTVRAKVEVDALELADEVARLRRQGSDEDDSVEESLAPREPEVLASQTDELAALFRDLRMDKATGGEGSADRRSPRRSLLEKYDQKLMPITGRALRTLKRQLADIEKDQIKALESDPEGWAPDSSRLPRHMILTFTVMEREAFEQGYGSAMEVSGTRLSVPREEIGTQGAEEVFSSLCEGVTAAVRASRESENAMMSGMARDVSRVHRLWRADEAERRVRYLAGRAYNRGLVQGLTKAGIEKFRVEVRVGCERCALLAGEVFDREGVPILPADLECRCMVLPAG